IYRTQQSYATRGRTDLTGKASRIAWGAQSKATGVRWEAWRSDRFSKIGAAICSRAGHRRAPEKAMRVMPGVAARHPRWMRPGIHHASLSVHARLLIPGADAGPLFPPPAGGLLVLRDPVPGAFGCADLLCAGGRSRYPGQAAGHSKTRAAPAAAMAGTNGRQIALDRSIAGTGGDLCRGGRLQESS